MLQYLPLSPSPSHPLYFLNSGTWARFSSNDPNASLLLATVNRLLSHAVASSSKRDVIPAPRRVSPKPGTFQISEERLSGQSNVMLFSHGVGLVLQNILDSGGFPVAGPLICGMWFRIVASG